MFIIASTRPLPIHYDEHAKWYFKRGIYADCEVTYPFFVEVERGADLQPVIGYIERFISQYTQYEMAIHADDWYIHFYVQQQFRHAEFTNGVIYLKR